MGPNPFYSYSLVPEAKPSHQPISVSLDIKYHPVVTNHIGCRVRLPDVMEITPDSFFTYSIPGFQCVFCIAMIIVKFCQRSAADNIHNGKVNEKVGF